MSIRLLFDENISPSLVEALGDLYPGSQHVRQAGDNGFIIVTKDKDFREFSLDIASPPKLIWIGLGNCTTSRIGQALRPSAVRVAEFAKSELSSWLVIREA